MWEMKMFFLGTSNACIAIIDCFFIRSFYITVEIHILIWYNVISIINTQSLSVQILFHEKKLMINGILETHCSFLVWDMRPILEKTGRELWVWRCVILNITFVIISVFLHGRLVLFQFQKSCTCRWAMAMICVWIHTDIFIYIWPRLRIRYLSGTSKKELQMTTIVICKN